MQAQGIEFTHNNTQMVFRPTEMWQMRKQPDKEFEERFFSRANSKFFGDIKKYWSASRQVLVITRYRFGQTSKVEYKLSGSELGKLTLVLA